MPKTPPIELTAIRRLAITAIFSDDVLFEKVVLKGGNALSLAFGMSGRTSLDLDFSIENDFDDFEDAKLRILTALTRRFSDAGFLLFDFKFERKPQTIAEGQSSRWGGYLVMFKLMESAKFESLKGNLDAVRRDSLVIGPSQQRVFSIDLSKYEYVKGKVAMDLDDYTVYVYSPVMIAIEKLRAICQQMTEYKPQRHPSPRARDFYDIHLILSTTGIDLTSAENRDLLRHIFAAKEVPTELMDNIGSQREFHRPDWDNVKASTPGTIEEYDYYFDYVLRLTLSLKTLREK